MYRLIYILSLWFLFFISISISLGQIVADDDEFGILEDGEITESVIYNDTIDGEPINTENIEKSYIFKILNELGRISSGLNSLEKNNKISLAINGFVKSLKTYFKSGKLNTNEIKAFKTFWGHGTCQISMLKY